MATSSITKDFVVKDFDAYAKLLNDMSKLPPSSPTELDISELKRSEELLDKYIFH